MNSFRYTGREWDAETSLYYYRARYYDPASGHFISEDPIGFVGGDLNLYAYVGGTPTLKVDPSGRQMICPFFNPGCVQQQGLSDCAKKVLQPYFPGLNLDDVALSPQLPGFANLPGFQPDAITTGNIISYQPGAFSGDAGGLSGIGHELTHVQQQQSSGFLPFMKDYLRDYMKNLANGMSAFDSYRNIQSERAAQAMENRIFDDIFSKNRFNPICKEYCK